MLVVVDLFFLSDHVAKISKCLLDVITAEGECVFCQKMLCKSIPKPLFDWKWFPNVDNFVLLCSLIEMSTNQ